MKILFIRHGQTDWNIQERVQGSSDIPLNETGIKQAHAVKEMLKKHSFDEVIVSPLERARHTASIVCEGRAVEMIIDRRIAERDFGKYEVVSYRQDTEYYKKVWSLDMNNQLETVESYIAFYGRVVDFLEEIIKKHYGKTVLLVAHGGVSIAVAHYFKGAPENGDYRSYLLDNCEIAEYDETDIKKKL